MLGRARTIGVRRWLPPLAIVVVLLGAWELAARLDVIANALHLEPFLVPAPSDIAQALWQDRGLLTDNAWVTLQEVLAGFALSVAAGVTFAIVLHLSPTSRRAFYPLLVASQTVPIVVVAPILVVWLGFGIGPKLAIIALICFFPITVNTLDGLGSVDPDLVKMMRTLDASRWQTLRRVEGPTALPYFFSGAKIAVANIKPSQLAQKITMRLRRLRLGRMATIRAIGSINGPVVTSGVTTSIGTAVSGPRTFRSRPDVTSPRPSRI